MTEHCTAARKPWTLLVVLLALGCCQPSSGWVPLISSPERSFHARTHVSAALRDADAVESSPGVVTTNPPISGVTLKLALDRNGGVGEISPLTSVRFTCDESLDMVHRLRRDSDAVVVGRGTVERDDCSLTVRRGVPVAQQPLRVILDPRLSLVLAQLHEGTKYKVLTDGLPTVIYHCLSDIDLDSLGLNECVKLVCLDSSPPTEGNRPGRYFSPRAVVDHLKEKFMVRHIMVEGGPRTALNFLQAGLVDRAVMVRAPITFEEPVPSGMTAETLKDAGLENVGKQSSGVDTIDYWARPGEAWPSDPVGAWP